MQETQVQPLGQEDPLERGMATHSSILAWRIPWTEEPGGLYSLWGCKESDMTEVTSYTCTHQVSELTKPKPSSVFKLTVDFYTWNHRQHTLWDSVKIKYHISFSHKFISICIIIEHILHIVHILYSIYCTYTVLRAQALQSDHRNDLLNVPRHLYDLEEMIYCL